VGVVLGESRITGIGFVRMLKSVFVSGLEAGLGLGWMVPVLGRSGGVGPRWFLVFGLFYMESGMVMVQLDVVA
jgi:hypothetical protein